MNDPDPIRALWPALDTLCRRVLLYELPETRALVGRMAHIARRERLRRPEDSIAVSLDSMAENLEALLERTQAPRSHREAMGEGPTLATKRKLTPDPVRQLMDRGRFTPHQAQACDEIRRVFRYLASRFGAQVRDYETAKPAARRARALPRQPLEAMPASIADAYTARFLPWSKAMSRRPVVRSNVVGSFSVFDLCIAVLVDELPLRRIERTLGTRNGTATERLKEALDQYGAGRG